MQLVQHVLPMCYLCATYVLPMCYLCALAACLCDTLYTCVRYRVCGMPYYSEYIYFAPILPYIHISSSCFTKFACRRKNFGFYTNFFAFYRVGVVFFGIHYKVF